MAPAPSPENAMLHALLVNEYTSVRSEWLEARSAQQHAMQWTFAAVALVLAGLLTKDVRHSAPLLFVLAASVVAFASTLAEAVWFGEVLRMERAALFLRGREATIHEALMRADRNQGELDPVLAPSPLAWETFRGVQPDHPAPWVPKSGISIVAPLALYGLAWLVGTTLLTDMVLMRDILDGTERIFAWAALVSEVVLYLLTTIYIACVAKSVLRTSSQAAALGQIQWPSPSPAASDEGEDVATSSPGDPPSPG